MAAEDRLALRPRSWSILFFISEHVAVNEPDCLTARSDGDARCDSHGSEISRNLHLQLIKKAPSSRL
ncbi:uncharacterized [Tachysurus ichikawai]